MAIVKPFQPSRNVLSTLRGAVFAASLSLLTLSTGCDSGSSQAGIDAADIQGAPIDSAPATKPSWITVAAMAPDGGCGTVSPTLIAMPPAAPEMHGAYQVTSFALLGSYLYKYPELITTPDGGSKLETKDQMPASIKALDAKKVFIKGFMLPSEMDKGRVKTFVLLKNTMGCCYGVAPMMNEWIYVSLGAGKTVEFTPDVPIGVEGTLEVGEEIEKNTVMSLYRLKADEVVPPVAQTESPPGS